MVEVALGWEIGQTQPLAVVVIASVTAMSHGVVVETRTRSQAVRAVTTGPMLARVATAVLPA